MLPIIAAIPICYFLDLSETNIYWVVIPTGVVSAVGIIYVTYVLMREGPIASYRKSRAARGKRNGS
jgi:hypothetical protein